MSYVEKFLIGIALLFSAVALLQDANYRHQFHALAALIKQHLHLCIGCFHCLELERQVAVAFLLTGALSLLLDYGVVVAVVGQVGWIVLEAVNYQDGVSLYEIQWAVINFLLLVVLCKEVKWCGNCCGKESKPAVQTKPVEAAASEQNKNKEAAKNTGKNAPSKPAAAQKQGNK